MDDDDDDMDEEDIKFSDEVNIKQL